MGLVRRFQPIAITIEGRRLTAQQILCSCGVSQEFKQSTRTPPAPEFVVQYFRNHDWTVGKKPAGDRCPACSRPKKSPPTQETKTVTHAEPPKGMTRDDRRVIFEKLQENYVGEKEGYASGWTDKRVAEDLGCAVVWVKLVRDEFFGPEGQNEDIVAMRAELIVVKNMVARSQQELKTAEKAVSSVQKLIDANADALLTLLRKAEAIERAVK